MYLVIFFVGVCLFCTDGKGNLNF